MSKKIFTLALLASSIACASDTDEFSGQNKSGRTHTLPLENIQAISHSSLPSSGTSWADLDEEGRKEKPQVGNAALPVPDPNNEEDDDLVPDPSTTFEQTGNNSPVHFDDEQNPLNPQDFNANNSIASDVASSQSSDSEDQSFGVAKKVIEAIKANIVDGMIISDSKGQSSYEQFMNFQISDNYTMQGIAESIFNIHFIPNANEENKITGSPNATENLPEDVQESTVPEPTGADVLAGIQQNQIEKDIWQALEPIAQNAFKSGRGLIELTEKVNNTLAKLFVAQAANAKPSIEIFDNETTTLSST